LRAFHEKRSREAVKFDVDLRVVILAYFILKLRSLGYRVIAASIGEQHLHALTELPHDLKEIRRIVGKCKQRASHAVRDRLPGSIWSEGGEFKWIKDKTHFHNVYGYIRTKQEAGTVVWSHWDDENWIDFEVPVVVMKRRKR
jgi:REP element-mobilizing transposase RayT